MINCNCIIYIPHPTTFLTAVSLFFFFFSLSFQKRPYSFTYGVSDEYSGTDFHREEERSDSVTRGSYKVSLPDGRVQIVNYVADDSGYKATVTYEGTPNYPSPSEYSSPVGGYGQQQAASSSYQQSQPQPFAAFPIDDYVPLPKALPPKRSLDESSSNQEQFKRYSSPDETSQSHGYSTPAPSRAYSTALPIHGFSSRSNPLSNHGHSTAAPTISYHGFSTPRSDIGEHGYSTPRPDKGQHGFSTPRSDVGQHGFSTPRSDIDQHGYSTPRSDIGQHGFSTPRPDVGQHGFSTPTPRSDRGQHGYSTPRSDIGQHGFSTPRSDRGQHGYSNPRSRDYDDSILSAREELASESTFYTDYEYDDYDVEEQNVIYNPSPATTKKYHSTPYPATTVQQYTRKEQPVRKERNRPPKPGNQNKKRQNVKKSKQQQKPRGFLPKFQNFEPSPENDRPDGTKALPPKAPAPAKPRPARFSTTARPEPVRYSTTTSSPHKPARHSTTVGHHRPARYSTTVRPHIPKRKNTTERPRKPLRHSTTVRTDPILRYSTTAVPFKTSKPRKPASPSAAPVVKSLDQHNFIGPYAPGAYSIEEEEDDQEEEEQEAREPRGTFIGPYNSAAVAYIKPTTYRPSYSKDIISKIRKRDIEKAGTANKEDSPSGRKDEEEEKEH